MTAAAQATRSGATVRLTWAGVGSYSYNAAVSDCAAGTSGTKPHAVAQAGSRGYSYDCNGNMTERAGQVLRYDAENRLTQVIGEAVTTYRYNRDGQRVTRTTGCTMMTYVGNYFEWSGSTTTMKSYYYAGGARVAERVGYDVILPVGRSSRLQQRQLPQRWQPDRDATLLPVGQRAGNNGWRPAHGLRLHRPEVGRQRGIDVLWGAVL